MSRLDRVGRVYIREDKVMAKVRIEVLYIYSVGGPTVGLSIFSA